MILELEHVTKLYRNGRGAEDISFALDAGEVLGLLGPNGSGKTTTMKAIVGLVGVTSGAIRICGLDAISAHEPAMRHAGCLIEAPALYSHITVLRNLQMAARFYPDVDDARVHEVLRLVEMDKYRHDKTGVLSLGMRQRVGIAAAILSRPRLLILDEPLNSLDIEATVCVREIVRRAAEDGAAVLISSHLASEIQQVATKVAIMRHGRLLAMKDMKEILTDFNSVEDYFMSVVQRYVEGISA